MNELEGLREALRKFADARDWNQFHSPKNLAMALAAESGELLEIFQWLTEEQSRKLDPKAQAKATEEIADILLYLVRLGDQHRPRRGGQEQARRERPQVPRGEGARQRNEVHRALAWPSPPSSTGARAAKRAPRCGAPSAARRRRRRSRWSMTA
jgi:NTP pyrophosphatase (non-canonical NTP hydrolase)